MARVTDPPDLVRTLARIRRHMRHTPLDHPQRAECLRSLEQAAVISSRRERVYGRPGDPSHIVLPGYTPKPRRRPEAEAWLRRQLEGLGKKEA